MAKAPSDYIWQSQRMAKDCETIDCPAYDPIKDFKRDPTGVYVLIKVNLEKDRIEMALCTKEHEIFKIFRGRKCQDIYDAVFKHEKKNNYSFIP